MFTDSKRLFDTIKKRSKISEKRLLIDLASVKDAYRKKEVTNTGFIRTQYNIYIVLRPYIADALMKNTENKLLEDLLSTGILQHPVAQWILSL